MPRLKKKIIGIVILLRGGRRGLKVTKKKKFS